MEPTTVTLVQAIIAAIVSLVGGGGVVGVVATFILKSRSLAATEFKTIVDNNNERIDQLQKRVDTLEKEKEDTEKALADTLSELNELKARNIIFENMHNEIPKAQWVKAADGKMISFNDAYARLFIHPVGKLPEEYIGATDTEFWGDEIGGEYWANDLVLYRTGQPTDVVETVLCPDGSKEKWLFHKWPITWNGKIIATAGMEVLKITEMERIIANEN